MSIFHAVVYTSTATRPMHAVDLDDLLIDARPFNEMVRVTGALIYSKDRFLQYFEGSPTAVARVYERIKRSQSHGNIVELLYQPIESRQFTHWHMAFAEAPSNMLQEMVNEYWEMALPSLLEKQTRSTGLKLLIDYWNTTKASAISDRDPQSKSDTDMNGF